MFSLRCLAMSFAALALVSLRAADAAGDELQRPAPGKKLHVFIFAGQSNMEGRADGRKLAKKDTDRLHAVRDRVQLAYNQRPIMPLDVVEPPDDIKQIYHLDRIFGPELFCGLALAEALPDEHILLIKVAVGATSLYGSWNPDWTQEKAEIADDHEAPKLYNTLVERINETLSGLKPADYEIHAMFWVQGESDNKNEQTSAAYGTLLRTLIERIRADLRSPELPFFLWEVGAGKVVEGMRNTAKEVSHVTLLRHSSEPSAPDFLPTMKNGHFNDEGMKRMGSRFAEAYLRGESGQSKR
jgi:hypothetical protein